MHYSGTPTAYYNSQTHSKQAHGLRNEFQITQFNEFSPQPIQQYKILMQKIKEIQSFHKVQSTIQEQILQKFKQAATNQEEDAQDSQTLENCLHFCIEQYHIKEIELNKVLQYALKIEQYMAGILEENKMDKEKYEEISDMAKYWHKENKMLAENNDKLQEELKLSKQKEQYLHMKCQYQKSYRNEEIDQYIRQVGQNERMEVQKLRNYIKMLEKDVELKENKIYDIEKQINQYRDKLRRLEEEIKYLQSQNEGLLAEINNIEKEKQYIEKEYKIVSSQNKRLNTQEKQNKIEKNYVNEMLKLRKSLDGLGPAKLAFSNKRNSENRGDIQRNSDIKLGKFSSNNQSQKNLFKNTEFESFQPNNTEGKSNSRKNSLHKHKPQTPKNSAREISQFQNQPEPLYGVKSLSRPSSASSLRQVSNSLHFNMINPNNEEKKYENRMKSIGLMTQPNEQQEYQQFGSSNYIPGSPIKKIENEPASPEPSIQKNKLKNYKIMELNINKMSHSIAIEPTNLPQRVKFVRKNDGTRKNMDGYRRQFTKQYGYLHTESSTCFSNHNVQNDYEQNIPKLQFNKNEPTQTQNEGYVSNMNKTLHKFVETLVARRTHKKKTKQSIQQLEKRRKQDQLNKSQFSQSFIGTLNTLRQSLIPVTQHTQNNLQTDRIINYSHQKEESKPNNIHQSIVIQKSAIKQNSIGRVDKSKSFQQPKETPSSSKNSPNNGIFNNLCDMMVRKRIKKQ